MVVGYALGNRNDQENDILVLGEDDSNVVTYSSSLLVNLSKACVPTCSFCSFQRKEIMTVPYSTIKISKKARLAGVREVMYVANSRPDQHSQIRSMLDLWGFSSYLDYLYTVCELGFLEGLIPVINLGFLTPVELKQLSEVSALVRIPLEAKTDVIHESLHKWDAKQRLSRRKKNVEWASKLQMPISVSYSVHKGMPKGKQKDFLEFVSKTQEETGMIHEVVLENYVTAEHLKSNPFSAPSQDDMLNAYHLAKSILPESVPVIVPVDKNDLTTFLKEGVRDLGQIVEYSTDYSGDHKEFDWESLVSAVEAEGLQLQQRFPLRKNFIKEEKYSNKLGQVFDSYRYKIKKETQEKAKESKVS